MSYHSHSATRSTLPQTNDQWTHYLYMYKCTKLNFNTCLTKYCTVDIWESPT